MSDEDAQPTTPEEMARWMVEQTGGELAGSPAYAACGPRRSAGRCATSSMRLRIASEASWQAMAMPMPTSGEVRRST
ncbi:MAG: hypothetical protein QOC54_228 [Baekduia sp.]|nr:hypothetical protein [Baekduia sp.]